MYGGNIMNKSIALFTLILIACSATGPNNDRPEQVDATSERVSSCAPVPATYKEVWQRIDGNCPYGKMSYLTPMMNGVYEGARKCRAGTFTLTGECTWTANSSCLFPEGSHAHTGSVTWAPDGRSAVGTFVLTGSSCQSSYAITIN